MSLSGSAGTPGCVATFAAYIAPYGSRRIDAAAGNESGFPGCAREEGPRPLAIGWLGGRWGGLVHSRAWLGGRAVQGELSTFLSLLDCGPGGPETRVGSSRSGK